MLAPELLLQVIEDLSPWEALDMISTYRGARFALNTRVRRNITIWTAIIPNKHWAEKISQLGLKLVLLAKNFDSMKSGTEIKSADKPCLALALTPSNPILTSQLDLENFRKYLRNQSKNMEIEHPYFKANISAVVNHEKGIILPNIGQLVHNNEVQYMDCTSSRVHTIQVKKLPKTNAVSIPVDQGDILVRPFYKGKPPKDWERSRTESTAVSSIL